VNRNRIEFSVEQENVERSSLFENSGSKKSRRATMIRHQVRSVRPNQLGEPSSVFKT